MNLRDIYCKSCNRFLGKTDSVAFMKCEVGQQLQHVLQEVVDPGLVEHGAIVARARGRFDASHFGP